MKTLEQSVAGSLDGSQNLELLPFLPYIMQDLEQLGTPVDKALYIIGTAELPPNARILDLGCGKGAISVGAAKKFGFFARGIDGVEEFIRYARENAERLEIAHICDFSVGDIREKIANEEGYDLVILGAIGMVLGDMSETLEKAAKALKPFGCILLDDGYIDDYRASDYENCLSKSVFYDQIEKAHFEIISEELFDKSELEEQNQKMFESIEKRIGELCAKFPEKKDMFLDYLQTQNSENYAIENKLVCGMWLLRKKY